MCQCIVDFFLPTIDWVSHSILKRQSNLMIETAFATSIYIGSLMRCRVYLPIPELRTLVLLKTFCLSLKLLLFLQCLLQKIYHIDCRDTPLLVSAPFCQVLEPYSRRHHY